MKCDVLQQIINHIERGIIYPVYEASIHLSIYKLLGEKKNDIDSFDNSIKYLYCYVQDSASQLIIVSLAKIFDQDKQSFSVYSLLKQCENYKRTSEDKKVIRTDKSKKLVKYFNLNEELIEIIKNPNKGNFFKKFNEEHLDRFLKGFEEELDLLKNLRDMHISHNDKKFNGIKYNVNKFDNLIEFSKNMIELIRFLIPIQVSYDTGLNIIQKNTFHIKDSLSTFKKITTPKTNK